MAIFAIASNKLIQVACLYFMAKYGINIIDMRALPACTLKSR